MNRGLWTWDLEPLQRQKAMQNKKKLKNAKWQPSIYSMLEFIYFPLHDVFPLLSLGLTNSSMWKITSHF